ncbi:HNH endonuclease signature motif containing protein, partial [Nocardiopsis coralli]|uniref:HNH endonuclease signature motif containing protein n=1 Tax=Nocardiopsis coralli TaxID=2772213 RepID=UPI002E2D600B
RQVENRDVGENPDEELYRAKLEHGLANLKRVKPATSVQTLDRTAHALGLTYNPNRAEKNEEAAFAERGARLQTSFAGFTFQAWGPASDGERLKAALASFTAPYGATEKTPGGAEGTTGTGADIELIPAGESVTSRYARTYDALISAAGFAHGHHGHTTNGNGNGFAGATTVAAGTDSVGHADGAGAGAGSGGPAAATGATAGGGCSQPPGTKAVINITVPLSALLGFGFAFNTDTDTNNSDGANGVGHTGAAGAVGAATAGGANTTGATGNTGASAAPGPEPGAEPGPDPGGGTGGGVTTTATATAGGTNANTGPPSTTPDFPGPSGFPGVPVSSGVAVTEDGNVLALSAVRAMAPTAQIRRLIFDDRTGLPLDLGRAHRLAPGYLRTAAFAGHTTCAWNGGCDVPVSQCEADHITEFSHGGETKATNLQPLCSTHNRAKYRHTRTENTPTNGTGGTGGGAKGGSGAEVTDTTDTTGTTDTGTG